METYKQLLWTEIVFLGDFLYLTLIRDKTRKVYLIRWFN